MQSARQWISFLPNKTINCVTHLRVWLCLMALPFENMQTKTQNCVTEWKRVDVGPFRLCVLWASLMRKHSSLLFIFALTYSWRYFINDTMGHLLIYLWRFPSQAEQKESFNCFFFWKIIKLHDWCVEWWLAVVRCHPRFYFGMTVNEWSSIDAFWGVFGRTLIFARTLPATANFCVS